MVRTGNRLIQSLSTSARETLFNAAQEVELPTRTILFRASASPAYVYFLTSGLASVVVTMPEGTSAEVGMMGCEAVVGAAALLGGAPMESDCFMQLAGSGLRVPLKVIRPLFDEIPDVRARILEFLQSQMNISAQLSACNKLHEAEARLARWLLMAADRAEKETLDLTQEFLADMLGSQRSTVALVAGSLQRSGFIDYSRGRVRIVDRMGLTDAACDCYPITRRMVETLYQ